MQNKQWYESIHRWDNVHEILSKCSIACTSWYAGTLLARQNWLNNFKCTKFLSHCLRVTPIKHKICVHCTPSNILKLFHIYIVHVHALNRNLIENSFFYNNMLNNRLVHVHQLSFSLHSKSSPMSKYTSYASLLQLPSVVNTYLWKVPSTHTAVMAKQSILR